MPRSSVDPSVPTLRYFAEAPLAAAQSVLALAKEAVRLRVEAETPPSVRKPVRGKGKKSLPPPLPKEGADHA